MKKGESVDLALILMWPVIAAIFSFFLEPKALGSVILFLVIPSAYLSMRKRALFKKTFLFTIITSITTIIVIDYVAQKSNSWIMYPNSILPFKFFGIVTFEVILWAFFTCFFIVLFYEYFLDKHITKKFWQPKMKYAFMIALIVFSLFLFMFFSFPQYLKVPYFYLVWGIALLLIPFLFQLFKYPKTTSKFFLAAAYFFYLHFIYEVTAMRLGWWVFPGKEFIGYVSVLGVTFPLEELLFWFILLTLATLSFYEFFDDDEK